MSILPNSYSNIYSPPTNFQTSVNTSNNNVAAGPGTALGDQSSIPTTVGSNKYRTDYYSGSQVAIFMGNIWLSDISMIEFNLMQKKMPFYGYKSQMYDQMAKGTQLIEGVFSVAYSHTNWLNMAMSKYLEFTNPAGSQQSISESDVQQFLKNLNAGNVDLQTLNYTTPVIGLQTPGDGTFANQSFDQKTEQLINFFWGNTSTAGNTYKVISPDNLPPFDITITFGNYPKDRPSAQDEFLSSHTVKVLSNIEITGYSMQVAITGEPIQEVYTFFARSMDTPLTRTPKTLTTVGDTKAGTSTTNQ